MPHAKLIPLPNLSLSNWILARLFARESYTDWNVWQRFWFHPIFTQIHTFLSVFAFLFFLILWRYSQCLTGLNILYQILGKRNRIKLDKNYIFCMQNVYFASKFCLSNLKNTFNPISLRIFVASAFTLVFAPIAYIWKIHKNFTFISQNNNFLQCKHPCSTEIQNLLFI